MIKLMKFQINRIKKGVIFFLKQECIFLKFYSILRKLKRIKKKSDEVFTQWLSLKNYKRYFS